jgi:hypothetical protein
MITQHDWMMLFCSVPFPYSGECHVLVNKAKIAILSI